MTPRERFLRVLNFQPPGERLPLIEWAAWWDQTIERWKGEGLPAELTWEEQLRHFGLDVMICIGPSPRGPGCPAPASHGAPVAADTAGYEAVLPHLYPEAAVADLVQRARELGPRHERGEVIVRLWLDGFFWFPRTLLGIENHLFAFYDQPALMHRINRDLAAFHLRALDALLPVFKPDMIGFAEDMSYNNGPMLSRTLFDEFLLPYYRQVIPRIHEHGVKVLVDSDGDITQMIPWLLDAGIEGVYPLERQAGVDINAIRRRHPRFLMLGGYDKMVMNKGEAAMRAEFERLLPAMRSGGYIPSVDHQTPPGVSLEDYRVYVRLFREYAEAAARAAPLGGGLAGREGARAPLRVLFLGNSQVRWACDVPEIVARLSRSAPDGVARIETDAVTVGGASLEALWRDGRPAAKLAAGGWDWVVCNELIYSYGGNSAAFREYARRFSEAAGKAGARILFFATGETAAARLASGPMHQDSLAMARACGGRVAGCGAAWLKAWEQRPALDLHHADRAHPNLLGYYLNACVLYAALTDCPPAGLDACGLPAEDAAFLQDIAWRQSVEDRRNETCVP